MVKCLEHGTDMVIDFLTNPGKACKSMTKRAAFLWHLFGRCVDESFNLFFFFWGGFSACIISGLTF